MKRFAALILFAVMFTAALPPECEEKLKQIQEEANKNQPSAEQPVDINFLTLCKFSHMAPDDPIVAPNLPGGSHKHDFFGNTSTNNASTLESLLGHGQTSCNRVGDTAAYWAPSLIDGTSVVNPTSINAYYRPGNKKDPASVKAFPAGLRVIAGSSKATEPQDMGIVAWGCDAGDVKASETPPSCPFDGKNGGLKIRIRFPDCWNGTDLDSADHQSHMAYSKKGACPDTHPVAVPQINMTVHYPSAGGPNAVLASMNSPLTGHADFFNAWDQATLELLVANCINAAQHCGAKGGGAALQPKK